MLTMGTKATSSLVYSSSSATAGGGSGGGGNGGGAAGLAAGMLSGSKPLPSFEDVVVTIPFSRTVKTTNLNVSSGTLRYDEATKMVRWEIGKMGRDKNPQLTGTVVFNASKVEECHVVLIDWKVPMASVSGLAVASLQLTNEKYRPYKGVRTITRSGRFQVRIGS